MDITVCKLGKCFVGYNRAYIYILYSKSHHVAYIGETNDANGVIGRLNGHVSQNGTFCRQILERRGIPLNEVTDLILFSCSLPLSPEYVSTERVYRRGVEYLVQEKLWETCGDLQPYLYIVSNVKYSDTSSLRSVQKIASSIFDAFWDSY